jgi:Bacteriophage head to tail connecting protein.
MEQRNHKPNDSKEVAKDILRQFQKVKAKRAPFESLYQSVANVAGPQWFGFTGEPLHPTNVSPRVLDSTVRKATRVYRSGMLSGGCGPATRWFGLEFEDPDFNKWAMARRSGQEKAWLQRLENTYYADFWKAGFYQQKEIGFQQHGLFGWESMYLDESIAGAIRFNARPLHECYFDHDFNSVVDRHFRAFKMSARDMKAKWGEDKLPEDVRQKLRSAGGKDEEATFDVVHAVMPRADVEQSLDRNTMKFASYYLLNTGSDKGQVISEGGYEEMPYIVNRAYRLPGTPYSYSPGTEALADVQMINEMKRLLLEYGQLAIAPPLFVPDDGFMTSRISFNPRAINYYRKDGNSTANDIKPFELGGDPRFDMELFQNTQKDINEAFYVDLFLTVAQRIKNGSTPTATEITELAGERNFLLSPLLINLQVESFTPTFERMYAIKERRGEIPPVPRELVGRDFKAVYTSPLMKAQYEYKINNTLSTYADVAQIVSMTGDVSVWENFDNQQAARVIAEQRGMPQEVLRDLEDALQSMKQKAQAAAQQQTAAGMQQTLEKYPGLAKAPEDGSPAEMVLNGVRGATQ